MTKQQYELKVVAHQPMPPPDKDGFNMMGIFPNKTGSYTLKQWSDDDGHWTLQKRMGDKKGSFSWCPISDEQANHIINGNRIIIDEDIVQTL